MGIANTFQSMQPDMKDTYSGTKKKRFGRVRKAMSELDTSKDPMAALRDKSYLNIKGKKGVAV
jgi:hypothetical protein